MNGAGEKLVSIITMIITVSILAVLFSKKANTSAVISSAADGLGSLLKIAVSPITS